MIGRSVDEERRARCLANVKEAQASYICALVYSVARMSETLYCFSRLVVVGRVHRFPSFSEEFELTQPFKGLNINGSLHMTIWTGVFIETFQAFGTTVRWASHIILSAQDHAAAGITKAGTATVFAWKKTG